MEKRLERLKVLSGDFVPENTHLIAQRAHKTEGDAINDDGSDKVGPGNNIMFLVGFVTAAERHPR